MTTKAQQVQQDIAAQALLDFTGDLTFDSLCDALYLLIEGRPDFDDEVAEQLCSRIAGIGWKRRRGLVA